MNAETSNKRESSQFVSFQLAGEEYGLPILRVQEIIRYEKLTRVPQTSTYVEGVLNLRGHVIPVVDLRKRFRMAESQRNASCRIVVVEVDRQVLGLLVDSVTEVRTVENSEIDPPPPMGTGVDADFIRGMGKLDDRLIILLDLDRIFSTEEKKGIREAAA